MLPYPDGFQPFPIFHVSEKMPWQQWEEEPQPGGLKDCLPLPTPLYCLRESHHLLALGLLMCPFSCMGRASTLTPATPAASGQCQVGCNP